MSMAISVPFCWVMWRVDRICFKAETRSPSKLSPSWATAPSRLSGWPKMCMSRLSVCLCNWFLWLALDLSKTDEYLALKFLTLKCSTRDNTEMRILKKLGKLRAAFFYKHINNLEYLCLAMDPVGSSLHDRENSEIPFPSNISTVTTFISCLVNRVLTLHQLGIHHGGECVGITWETYTGRANIDFFF